LQLFNQIQEAVAFIRQHTDFQPHTGIILGTGLGDFAQKIDKICEIDYAAIPHFPVSTVESHQGKLIFGYVENQPVVCMAGRFHYYEGYSMKQVTFPIRVLKFLGIIQLWITNVSGGTNANYEAGDLVFVKDHINMQPENPLRGENDERLGRRFPDMLKTYNIALNNKALDICKKHNYRAHEGIYLALQGPNLETPAEYSYINRIGADLVGMSTVPEVLVAKHSDLDVFVVSIVSNKCFPIEDITETTLEEVIAVASIAAEKMEKVIVALLKDIKL
jgi:purine-nucleoside phosphorylase